MRVSYWFHSTRPKIKTIYPELSKSALIMGGQPVFDLALENLRQMIKDNEKSLPTFRWVPVLLSAAISLMIMWALFVATAGATVLLPMLSPSFTLAIYASLVGATGTWLLPAVRAAQAELNTMKDILDVGDMIRRWRPDSSDAVTVVVNSIYRRRGFAAIESALSTVSMRSMIVASLLPIPACIVSLFTVGGGQIWTLIFAWTCIVFGYMLLVLFTIMIVWRRFGTEQ